MRAALLVVAALTLAGCETTAERSAQLERAAKQVAAHRKSAQRALTVIHPSAHVKVVSTTLLRGSETAAVVVTVRNDSARPLQTVPIEITLKDAAGKTTYQNREAGLEAALVSVPSLAPHATLSWVDDQVTAGTARSVSARVGESPAAARPLPAISVSGLHLGEASSSGVGVEGRTANNSAVAQRNLVVFVTATRGGRVTAAGRAVVSELPAHSTRPFNAFLAGDPRGAQLGAGAPASTPG